MLEQKGATTPRNGAGEFIQAKLVTLNMPWYQLAKLIGTTSASLCYMTTTSQEDRDKTKKRLFLKAKFVDRIAKVLNLTDAECCQLHTLTAIDCGYKIAPYAANDEDTSYVERKVSAD
jgi:hypothetical protein